MKDQKNDPLTKEFFEKAMQSIGRRFDNVDRRFDGVDERLDGMDKRFDGMDKRLDGMDKRLDGMDKRLDGMDKRFDGMDKRFDGIDRRLDGMDKRFDGMDKRFDRLDEYLENDYPKVLAKTFQTRAESEESFSYLRGRLDALDGHVGDLGDAVRALHLRFTQMEERYDNFEEKLDGYSADILNFKDQFVTESNLFRQELLFMGPQIKRNTDFRVDAEPRFNELEKAIRPSSGD